MLDALRHGGAPRTTGARERCHDGRTSCAARVHTRAKRRARTRARAVRRSEAQPAGRRLRSSRAIAAPRARRVGGSRGHGGERPVAGREGWIWRRMGAHRSAAARPACARRCIVARGSALAHRCLWGWYLQWHRCGRPRGRAPACALLHAQWRSSLRHARHARQLARRRRSATLRPRARGTKRPRATQTRSTALRRRAHAKLVHWARRVV